MEVDLENFFKGFSKLKLSQRYQRLLDAKAMDSEDVGFFKSGGIDSIELADHFIENSIGYFQLPIGVATNFRIDGVDYVIPMAVEETSIIAAASKTARWIREAGELTTEVIGNTIIGQIQIAQVQDFANLKKCVEQNEQKWIEELNREVAAGMVRRGGGVKSLFLRSIERPDGKLMAVLHVQLDPCDAMGANVINQVCEYLAHPLEEVSGETVTMKILSNLVDTRLTKAKIVLKDVDAKMGEAIEEASLFAELDPYRAATNNKGVLNGIDPILIATGNDWRAVEAGIHAFACREGRYQSITRWRYREGVLTGEFLAPLIVGTVGGVTSLHPAAKMAMKMMRIESASHLSRICAAVGLTQNLGALRALTTVGIIEGHMKLHIKNLAMGAGANDIESPILQKLLEQVLAAKKRISLSDATMALKKMRAVKENVQHQATSEI
ncbi:MAG: hydroxymethylglutaryl-CoA reductase, degradative [Bdellovibrionaceae bacterium]|nr:hydroxymethylglutaryl-CoA reductase, degradative [Pseudobdellovibrionaceae bacterium]